MGKYKILFAYRFTVVSFQNNDTYFEVRINDQQKIFEKNENPITYKNINVFAGDKYWPSADVEIKKFYACKLSSSRGKLKQDFLMTFDDT